MTKQFIEKEIKRIENRIDELETTKEYYVQLAEDTCNEDYYEALGRVEDYDRDIDNMLSEIEGLKMIAIDYGYIL